MIPVLKAVHADMTANISRHTKPFVYPTSGWVRDRDGHGLHGFPWGIGSMSHWNNIVPAKFLILLADHVELMPGKGKCVFQEAQVVGVHDYLDEAACQMASLTLWWNTPEAVDYMAQVSEDEYGIVVLAIDAKREMDRRCNLLAEGVAMREQALRTRAPQPVATGILVDNWPVERQMIRVRKEK